MRAAATITARALRGVEPRNRSRSLKEKNYMVASLNQLFGAG
jgi:hypothetical protein